VGLWLIHNSSFETDRQGMVLFQIVRLPCLPCETVVAVVSPGLNSEGQRSLPRRSGRSYWGVFNRGSDLEINKILSVLSALSGSFFLFGSKNILAIL